MIIILCIVFSLFDLSTSLDFSKCSIYDSKCQKDFYQYVGRTFAYTGIPAIGIPVIDPYKLTNETLSILGLLNLTLVEGEVKGIGKCIVTKYNTNVESRFREVVVICDTITIDGHYILTAAPSMGQACGWCNIHGDGNGTIQFENWLFKFKYPFKILRHSDGNIFLKGYFDQTVFEAEVDKVTVHANGVKMGDEDISKSITSFINNNWKLIMDSNIGMFINDKSAEYYYKVYGAFFDRVPAHRYMSDDLSALVDM